MLSLIADRVAPDWIQLHGKETPAAPAEVRTLRPQGRDQGRSNRAQR
ncbi:MAG: hypothetical protein WDN76_08285 [Alphaproteobacteria bacterium]